MSKPDKNSMSNAAGIPYGELIRRQRKKKKMNQEELGALVHIGKNAVGAWEAGRSRPDVSSVPVICDALDLSLEEFFGRNATLKEQDEGSKLNPLEREELISRYLALDAYHRQLVLREMEMLHDMQELKAKKSKR